jgi:hypothetical protein
MVSSLIESALVTGRKVGWRVALAALLCMVASAAGATNITCTNPTPDVMGFGSDAFFPDAFGCQTLTATFAPGFDSSHTYVFDSGRFEDTLSFGDVLNPDGLTVAISAFLVTPGDPAFLNRVPAGFRPDTFLVQFPTSVEPIPAWVYLRVEGPPTPAAFAPCPSVTDCPDTFPFAWTQEYLWFGDGQYSSVQVLQDHGEPANPIFSQVVTIPGSFTASTCPNPALGCDPDIRSGADDFSSTIVVNTIVPEPASLLLIASGVGGAFVRRRLINARLKIRARRQL